MTNAPLIERIFGPNWRSTLYGFLTKVSFAWTAWNALPESARTDPNVFIPALLTFLTGMVQDANTKDKQVSGTPGTGQIVGAKGVEPRIVEPPNP